MLELFHTHFQEFIRNVRIVDFLDIGIISVFLYLLLNWLRQSASKRSLISIIILVLLYALARLTEMYLTEILIEGLFIVILIGAVVVFQSDIRRLVDRISSWDFLWKDSSSTSSSVTTDILTEAAAKMASERIGALIVIKGKESWDRHVHGGIGLDGNISSTLLYSLFNTKAPGHDGAILMQGEKIVRFATHLPLSTRLSLISRGGTRHAAALGLSERCDAFIIVVSEERGIISVAQSGQISELSSSNELKSRLNDFWQEHYQPKDTSFIHWWQKRNLRTVSASLAIAITLWFAFAFHSGTVYRAFEVPIEYRNLQSSNIILSDSIAVQARVTLSGPEQAFQLLDPSQLVISFNLDSEKVDSNQLQITAMNINLPSELHLYEVNPKSLAIKASNIKRLKRHVKISTKGNLPGQLALKSMVVIPSPVPLVADRSSIKDIPDSLNIKPIDLSKIKKSTTLTPKLNLPEKVWLDPSMEDDLRVKITVKKKN